MAGLCGPQDVASRGCVVSGIQIKTDRGKKPALAPSQPRKESFRAVEFDVISGALPGASTAGSSRPKEWKCPVDTFRPRMCALLTTANC